MVQPWFLAQTPNFSVSLGHQKGNLHSNAHCQGTRMSDLLTALALAVALEGIIYALFPEGMKRVMAVAIEQPSSSLRLAGLAAAGLGVGAVWLIRG